MYLNKKILTHKYNIAIFSIIFFTLLFSLLFTYGKDYKVTPLSEIRQNSNMSNSNKEKLQELSESKINEDMLIVDLSNMKISLVQKGEIIKDFKIVSIGKPGSYYETPAGNYEIKGKFGNKFSNLGQVYMPYAMQFYGNFFIHGIPYYPNGTKVSSSYSGGCIRLSDNDAKEIYNFSKINTRLLILNNNVSQNKLSDLGQEKSKNILAVLTSLEVLNQEKYVTFNNKKVQIKTLNKYILENNTEAINIIENNIGKDNFLNSKKEKVIAIGISDYSFDLESDRKILADYITNNKSYILTLLN